MNILTTNYKKKKEPKNKKSSISKKWLH